MFREWPKWMYGPNGESQIFNEGDKIPSGWKAIPKADEVEQEEQGLNPVPGEPKQFSPLENLEGNLQVSGQVTTEAGDDRSFGQPATDSDYVGKDEFADMDKNELATYAKDKHGVDLDKRKGVESLRNEVRQLAKAG
jgi:hypothetical protein